MVPDHLSQFPQHGTALVAVDNEFYDLAFASGDDDKGVFRLFRERRDPVHLVFNVCCQLLQVGINDRFHGDPSASFVGNGSDLFDTVYGPNRLFNRQDDSLFDLLRARAGIGDRDINLVTGEFREDLLLDPGAVEKAADKQENHHQIGGNGVSGHPGNGAFFVIVIVLHCHSLSFSRVPVVHWCRAVPAASLLQALRGLRR